MRHLGGRFLLAVVLAGALAPVVFRPQVSARSEALPTASENHSALKWLGVMSCATTACHHAGAGVETKGSEYSTWTAHDQHVRAYDVLFGDRAEAIVHNYFPDKDVPAHKEALCRKCHATANPDDENVRVDARFSLRDGVGCERCHGPAEKWLDKHSRDDFKQKTPAEKATLGLRDTKGLIARFELCAGCHIGGADRAVDHALIASGHPPLRFHFSGFLAKYAKHWPTADDRARYPDYEARAWLVGQVGGVKAALELLKARADRAAEGGKNWPEYAEYGCFACHKRFGVPRRILADPSRRPGELPWNPWYLSVTPTLARQDHKSLDNLRRLMRAPGGDPSAVSSAAAAAVNESGAWLRRLDNGPNQTEPLNKADMRTLLLQLAADEKRLLDWDEAAQRYLGAAALGQELTTDPRRPALQDNLRATADLLRTAFPEGVASPTFYGPERAAAFQKQMTDLRKLLEYEQD